MTRALSRQRRATAAVTVCLALVACSATDARPNDTPVVSVVTTPVTDPAAATASATDPTATGTGTAAGPDVEQCLPNDDDGTVTIWHSMGGQASIDLWQQFESEFERTHAIRLDVQSFAGESAVMDALRTTDRSEWPDLVNVSEQNTRTMLDSGQFLPPAACDPAVGADLLPLVRATYTVDEELVALPFGVSVPVLVFDASEFRAAGLDVAAPPATLDDLLTDSATLVDSGASPFGLVVTDSCANMVLAQYSAKRGVPEGLPDNGRETRTFEVDYATADNIAALSALAGGVVDGHVKYIGGSQNNLDDLVAVVAPVDGGAMTVHTSGALVDVIRILAAGSYPGVELGVGPLPGPGAGSLIGGNAFWLPRGDGRQVGRAWTVLDWLYEPEHLGRLAAETGYVPATEAAANDPALLQQWHDHPQLKVAYDQVLATRVSVASSGALFGPSAGRAGVLYEACDKILGSGADVAETLSAASVSVNTLLTEYEAQRNGSASPPPSTAEPSPAPPSELISGTVQCASGSDVVGIWVEAEIQPESHYSRWAAFEPSGDGTAEFSYRLQYGGRFQLHVGCGGTPGEWGSTSFTDFVSGSHDFLCHDDPPRRGSCDTR